MTKADVEFSVQHSFLMTRRAVGCSWAHTFDEIWSAETGRTVMCDDWDDYFGIADSTEVRVILSALPFAGSKAFQLPTEEDGAAWEPEDHLPDFQCALCDADTGLAWGDRCPRMHYLHIMEKGVWVDAYQVLARILEHFKLNTPPLTTFYAKMEPVQ